MEQGTLLLPDLAGALRRHLQELPSVRNGLSLTEQLLLETLAGQGPMQAGRLVALVMHDRDPLPGLGDISHDRILRELGKLPEPPVERHGGHPIGAWNRDTVAITARGQRDWRWNEARQDVVLG
jgi:hypothetical protein